MASKRLQAPFWLASGVREELAGAQVPGIKAAIGQHYNSASDRYISHDGVVYALAKAAGVEANIVHYDTKAVSLAKVSVHRLSSLLPVPILVLAAFGSYVC